MYSCTLTSPNAVGKNKKEAVKVYGKDQVKSWRRAFDDPPPPMEDDHEFHPAKDPRYRDVRENAHFAKNYLAVWQKFASGVGVVPVVSHGHIFSLSSLFLGCVGQQILHLLPKAESLKDTVARSSVYWDQVLAPSLHQGKTLLIVGHENNLRSLIMRLEGIPPEDMVHLNLPRAVPLAYRLDENLKPLDRPDGKLDEATGYLRGEWIGGDEAVQGILARDYKQVYDTNVTQNLELAEERDKFNGWMDFLMGKPPTPNAAAPPAEVKSTTSTTVEANRAPVKTVNGLNTHSRSQSSAAA
jgi:bisphosphoglycerate-dependent phosphoglycerate mutase